eukprot:scaffold262_cov164-Ochromonas_danica.AAC.6
MPREVDFRVMLTFLEFYEVFMRFVLFKLYHTQGIAYPPTIDPVLEAEGCCLLAIQDGEAQAIAPSLPTKTSSSKKTQKVDEKLQTQVTEIVEHLDENEKLEEEDEDEMGTSLTGPLSAAFSSSLPEGENGEEQRRAFAAQLDESSRLSTLFEGLVFFLNREIPRSWLQLCVTAFGGRVGWQGPGSPLQADDPHITHHIVDRPMQAQSEHAREYIQPQWVFDSINAQMLLSCRIYAPGAKLPPHLSPFVDDEKEGYMPQYREEIRKLQGKPVRDQSEKKDAVKEDEEEAEENEEENEEEDDNEAEEEESEDGEEEEEEEEVKEELEEVPVDSKKGPKAIVFKAKGAKISEYLLIRSKGNRRFVRFMETVHRKEKELRDLSVTMMSKKTKRLYDRMQYGIAEKNEASKRLESKRKSLESQLEEAPAPKSSRKKARK